MEAPTEPAPVPALDAELEPSSPPSRSSSRPSDSAACTAASGACWCCRRRPLSSQARSPNELGISQGAVSSTTLSELDGVGRGAESAFDPVPTLPPPRTGGQRACSIVGHDPAPPRTGRLRSSFHGRRRERALEFIAEAPRRARPARA